MRHYGRPWNESCLLTALRLAEILGDRWHEAIVLANLGELAARSGQPDKARELGRRSVVIDRSIGNYAGVALTLVNLAESACAAGDLEEAGAVLREALPLSQLADGAFVSLWVLFIVARVQVQLRVPETAAPLLRSAAQHPAASDDLRVQVRRLAATAGIELGAEVPPLMTALAAAEAWLAQT